MRDESQNALLKTLEEPPGFAHLILLSSEPDALLETIASRCQPVEFAALPSEAVEAALGGGGEEITAAARLSAGDLELARFLLTPAGKKRRAAGLEVAGPVGPTDPTSSRPWRRLLGAAEEIGSDAEAAAREALAAEKEAGVKRSAKETNDEAKRAGRRKRTETLDLGLSLCASWFRDLTAVGSGAAEVTFNRDYLPQLHAAAEGLDPAAGRRAAELVQDTRRRLDLNVSEELALEALYFRLEREIG
jgi:DNA polymerase-3 subunit delta'